MSKKTAKSKKDDFEISAESYAKAIEQVDDAVIYFRFYHYLSRLNKHCELKTSEHGAIIIPDAMLKCMGYGFARDGDVFCIHLTGVLYHFFERFFPTQCVIVSQGHLNGIEIVTKPLNYADYSMPPLRFFFPIIAKYTFDKMSRNSRVLNITQIELSVIDQECYEVKAVADNYVKISTIQDITNETDNTNHLRNML